MLWDDETEDGPPLMLGAIRAAVLTSAILLAWGWLDKPVGMKATWRAESAAIFTAVAGIVLLLAAFVSAVYYCRAICDRSAYGPWGILAFSLFVLAAANLVL